MLNTEGYIYLKNETLQLKQSLTRGYKSTHILYPVKHPISQNNLKQRYKKDTINARV